MLVPWSTGLCLRYRYMNNAVGWMGWPPKYIAKTWSTEPRNRTSFVERIFADVIKLKFWKWYHSGSPRWDLNPTKSVLIRNRKGKDTHKWEGCVKMEAVIGMPQWQTKEHQGLLPPPESGRGKNLPLNLRKEHGPANTFILDVWPPEFWENEFLWF